MVDFSKYEGHTIHNSKTLISASQVLCKISLFLNRRHSDRPVPVPHIVEGEENSDLSKELKILILASQVLCKIPLLLDSRHSDRPVPVSHIVEGEEPLNSDFIFELDKNFAVLTLTPLPHLGKKQCQ